MSLTAVHLIRLDGSHKLGLGHVYRIRELASYLRQKNQESLFLVNDNISVLELLQDFNLEVLTSEYTEDEVKKKMTSIINSRGIRTIISDLLFYPKSYINFLKTVNIPKVSFHEHVIEDNFSDVLVNYNTFKNSLSTLETNDPNCLGPKYCILPRNLLNCKTISIKRQVKKVLITFGGSDPQNFTSKVIKLLDLHKNFFKNINEIMLHIGSENIKKEEVKALADRSSLKLNLVSEIKDFSSLMEESDLAICSGGNTMYELCYLGIPSIVLPQNNHQRNFSSELNKYGYLKIVNVNVSDFENTFISTLLDLLNDYSLRKEYNQKSTNLFDGLGLDRISERIIDIQNK